VQVRVRDLRRHVVARTSATGDLRCGGEREQVFQVDQGLLGAAVATVQRVHVILHRAVLQKRGGMLVRAFNAGAARIRAVCSRNQIARPPERADERRGGHSWMR